jgi:hypothetical protein
MTPEQFRRFGRQIIDWIADYRARTGDQPVMSLAFEAASVEEARAEVMAAGGRAVGEVVTLTTADGRRVTWCYVTDPEGKILELQSWA